MEKLQADNDRLRKALIGLVGAETKEDLQAMKDAIGVMPASQEDRIVTINAIQALLDTMPQS